MTNVTVTVHVFMGYDANPAWQMYRKHIEPWMERHMSMIDATDRHSLHLVGWRASYDNYHHYYLFRTLDKYNAADRARVAKYMKENA